MSRRSTRRDRQVRPGLEGLEPRALLAMLPIRIGIADPFGKFAAVPNLQASLDVASDRLSNLVPVANGSTAGVEVTLKPTTRPGPVKPTLPIYFPRGGWRETTSSQSVRNQNIGTLDIDVDPNYLTSKAYVGASASVPADKLDFATLAMRAVLQGLAYYGLASSSSLNLPDDPRGNDQPMGSPFDKYLVRESNGSVAFTGPRATEIHGGPIPILVTGQSMLATFDDPATTTDVFSYYNDFPDTIMRPTIPTGQRFNPTNLDAAVLQDVGLKSYSLITDDAVKRESEGEFTVSAVVGGPFDFESLEIHTEGRTATEGLDFDKLDQSFNLTTETGAVAEFTIPIRPDNLAEGPEVFDVVLARGSTVVDRITLTIGSTAGDFDGDGATDTGVYQPGLSSFFLRGTGGTNQSFTFGQGRRFGGDPVPIVGDFDGDGKADRGVYQPGPSSYFIQQSTAGNQLITFGQGRLYGGDPVPIVGDFDGDGKDDLGVYQPETSGFFVRQTRDSNRAFLFGQGRLYGGDPIPVVGDFDGDGKADPGVYQPDTSGFFLRRSQAGDVASTFGQGRLSGGNPTPVIGDFDSDGLADLGIFQPKLAQFFLLESTRGPELIAYGRGRAFGGDPIPVIGDFDGDGRTDLGVYETSTSTFFLRNSGSRTTTFSFGQGRLYGGDPAPLIPSPGALALLPIYRITKRRI